MPRVKIDYIVSFSSEDKENQANNLLSWEINKKKWLCKEGEPSCSVVLQLAKAIQIESVNIGVHHTALVEVLVGLSEKPNDPFEVLVPSCVFVSAADSRRGDACERVRSFSGEQLARAREQRWDRVRVVCSQPYNKRVKYGLSFVHLYSAEGKDEIAPAPAPTPALPLSLLALGTCSSDEEEFHPGELFAQRNAPTNTNTDAQIRQASSQALNNISDTSTKLIKTPITKNNSARPIERQQTDRQRDSLIYTTDDDRPHDRIDRLVRSHREKKSEEERGKKRRCEIQEGPAKREKTDNRQREANTEESGGPAQRDKVDSNKQRKANVDERRGPAKTDKVDSNRQREVNMDETAKEERSAKRETNETDGKVNKHDEKKRNAFHKPERKRTGGPILGGVVFSLSGYENPRRGRVRDAAVSLGARFEPHALRNCTHLVCAFPNTPKLRELQRVSPAALAVRAEWVEHCVVAGRRLPEPPYAPGKPLPPAPSPPRTVASPAHTEHDSDADTDDEIERATRAQRDAGCDELDASSAPSTSQFPRAVSSRADEPGAGRGGASCSDTECDEPDAETWRGGASGSDVPNSGAGRGGASGSDTETDEPPPPCVEPKVLPAMFEGSQFALDPRLPPATLALLARYLRAYGALVLQTDELDEDSAVDYVVSERGDVRGMPGAAAVTPRWVWRCHRRGCLPTPTSAS